MFCYILYFINYIKPQQKTAVNVSIKINYPLFIIGSLKVVFCNLEKMVFICCVPSCDSENVKTHSFPKNQEDCQKWINATKTYKLTKEDAWSTHHQVCYKHFKKEDYIYFAIHLRSLNVL